MSDPLQRPTPEYADWARENRLFEIRREAEEKGHVQAIGVRPPGAPFPAASPQTGYYGIPLLKKQPWKWEIPAYFFVGGAAGSAAVIGAAARWIGARSRAGARLPLPRAPAVAIVSSALADLGPGTSGALPRHAARLQAARARCRSEHGRWQRSEHSPAALPCAELLNERFTFVPVRLLGNVAEVYVGTGWTSVLQLHRSADWRQRHSSME